MTHSCTSSHDLQIVAHSFPHASVKEGSDDEDPTVGSGGRCWGATDVTVSTDAMRYGSEDCVKAAASSWRLADLFIVMIMMGWDDDCVWKLLVSVVTVTVKMFDKDRFVSVVYFN